MVKKYKSAKAELKGKVISTKMPPVEFMKECVTYDESSSTFLRWNNRPVSHFERDVDHKAWNTRWAGKEVGSPNNHNYNRLLFIYQGIKYYLKTCRVVYKLHNPDEDISDKVIDHKDHNTLNDSISNIRAVPVRQNCLNRKAYKHFYPRITTLKRVGYTKYAACMSNKAGGTKKNWFYSKPFDTAAEAYIACWQFMLSDKEFRDTSLDLLTDKEVEGFFIKKALEELNLPMEGMPLTLR